MGWEYMGGCVYDGGGMLSGVCIMLYVSIVL